MAGRGLISMLKLKSSLVVLLQGQSNSSRVLYTDKKENHIFLINKEIQSGAVAKSYMRKGFLIYEEILKYFPYMSRA